jgi:uncharacterized membrane protein YeaQ/YmgE (transglycosylase-associated protein family)
MTSMAALWLAILASSVLVFLASSVIHMASPWHKSDYPRYSRESDVLDAPRPLTLPPGDYFMPRASSMAEMKSSEFIERMSRGPIVLMTVFPNGPVQMGGTLMRWFLYLVVVGALAAYVASAALPPGAPSGPVFRVVFATAFASHALGLWQLAIWYRRAWSITIKSTVDAVIYAAITAAVFVWLWPR